MKLLKRQTLLKDAMYNFSQRSGASNEYCKGMLVGVVSALMATGESWEDAISHAAINMPDDSRIGWDAHDVEFESVPESWVHRLRSEFRASRNVRAGRDQVGSVRVQ